jgi:hypothetical protein
VPARRDIAIYQGDTYEHELRLEDADGQPINLTGRTYASQIRKRPTYDTVAATFTVDDSDAANGVIRFLLAPADTLALDPGAYRYDIQQDFLGVVTTLLFGQADVTAEVTRL